MRIKVKTLFDCSATGTTGNFRAAQVPYQDRAGNVIRDFNSWMHSRNQQRNWETLLQLMGLRCQIDNIDPPTVEQGLWQFSFEVDRPEVYGNDLALLLQDCEGVPMVQPQTDQPGQVSVLTAQGPDRNIWFESVNM